MVVQEFSPEEYMREMLHNLRALSQHLEEYPAEWPDDLLAEVGNAAATVKGQSDTERLTRAMSNDSS